jgi:hypothetical protein
MLAEYLGQYVSGDVALVQQCGLPPLQFGAFLEYHR